MSSDNPAHEGRGERAAIQTGVLRLHDTEAIFLLLRYWQSPNDERRHKRVKLKRVQRAAALAAIVL